MKFKGFTSLLLCSILIVSCTSKKLKLKTVFKLPKTINESSGLIANADSTFWTNNDSGDKPQIYLLDSVGKIIRTVFLKSVTHIDFEEITTDIKGNIYVGDFGNNYNNRKDLKIYKLTVSQLVLDTVQPEIISFRYSDQKTFPPAHPNFDCEAMVCFNDSLYLFSKSRAKPKYSKLYKLPANPGNYTAQLLDSIKTKRWITAAAIDKACNKLVLLSENKLNLFYNFTAPYFFKGEKKKIKLNFSQKEAISFKNDGTLFISDEKWKWIGGKVYYSKFFYSNK